MKEPFEKEEKEDAFDIDMSAEVFVGGCSGCTPM